jgi:hypothetical protein
LNIPTQQSSAFLLPSRPLSPHINLSPSLTRTLAAAASSSTTSASSSSIDGDLSAFFSYFRGEFDNAQQVAEERAQGLEAGPSGGHEQIHCILQPLPDLPNTGLGMDTTHILGATYYFDNKPEAVFRCRLYSFHPPPPSSSTNSNAIAEMRLHRFTPDFEGYMRQNKYDLGMLPCKAEELAGVVEELEGCSILWSRAAEAELGIAGPAFRGLMREGFCIVSSQREADIKLKIEDDLLLTSQVLSVNDRGTDCATGRLVYGNHRSLPYRMERRK